MTDRKGHADARRCWPGTTRRKGKATSSSAPWGAWPRPCARDEPACLVYRAARSVDDPDVFVLYEEYEDEAALLAHRETPHFKDLIEGVIVPAARLAGTRAPRARRSAPQPEGLRT